MSRPLDSNDRTRRDLDPRAREPGEAAELDSGTLGPGLAVEGTVRGRGHVRLDGTLRGQIDLEGGLTIGPQAQVVAPMRATRVEVLGEVHGTIEAQHVVVKSGGWVSGDVRAGTIAIDDGATLEGLIDMDFDTDSRARASAPAGRAEPRRTR